VPGRQEQHFPRLSDLGTESGSSFNAGAEEEQEEEEQEEQE